MNGRSKTRKRQKSSRHARNRREVLLLESDASTCHGARLKGRTGLVGHVRMVVFTGALTVPCAGGSLPLTNIPLQSRVLVQSLRLATVGQHRRQQQQQQQEQNDGRRLLRLVVGAEGTSWRPAVTRPHAPSQPWRRTRISRECRQARTTIVTTAQPTAEASSGRYATHRSCVRIAHCDTARWCWVVSTTRRNRRISSHSRCRADLPSVHMERDRERETFV